VSGEIACFLLKSGHELETELDVIFPPVKAGTRFQSTTVRMLHLCLRIGYGEEALKIEKTRGH
jgi:hypothetical protein